jgi:hypothetical protein
MFGLACQLVDIASGLLYRKSVNVLSGVAYMHCTASDAGQYIRFLLHTVISIVYVARKYISYRWD